MASPPIRFFSDYVDPLSYLLHRELGAFTAEPDAPDVERVPMELRSPPAQLVDPEEPWWRQRWEEGSRLASERGLRFVEPVLVPWTRKAHELACHLRSMDIVEEGDEAVFRAFLLEGRDIGRVDVLVDIAVGLGLDATETKAVLDVDKYADEVASARSLSAGLGEEAPPVLVRGDTRLRGFHNRDRLRTFLCSPQPR